MLIALFYHFMRNKGYFIGSKASFLLLFLLLMAGLSCQRDSTYHADFRKIDPDRVSDSTENVGVFGGSARITRKPVEAGGAVWSVESGQLHLDFEELGYFSITPEVIGLPGSWNGLGTLNVKLRSDTAATLFLEVYGRRSRLRDTLVISKGRSSHAMDIRETPLLGGLEVMPDRIRITSADPSGIQIGQMWLTEGKEQVYLVDRWGQRVLSRWPGKVETEEQLIDLSGENSFLDSLASINDGGSLDPYGGYAGRELLFDATGFFRVDIRDGRWWLVTPLGNPFYSLGVNGVRIKSFRSTADVTRIEGREELFEEVPDYGQCPHCFMEDSTYFSFYSWNIRKKYPTIEKWKEQTEKRLQTIGFNTIGNWSDTLYYLEPEMPYTYTLDSRRNPEVIMSNGMPDVFHPGWEEHLSDAFSMIAGFREDPFLLGYFVDNEMGWGAINRPDSSSHTFPVLEGYETEAERRTVYAERYFSTIRQAIRKHDHNHLYMGCRFTRNFRSMEPVAEAAGRHVDILSINVYSGHPIKQQMDQWYRAARRPMLIGEHHIPPRTPKQLWPRYPNFPLPERDSMLTNYISTWAGYPYAVGSHWYQYKDQEVAGRGDGGENQPIGLVTVADQPNYPLLETYHRIANQLPEWLGAGYSMFAGK